MGMFERSIKMLTVFTHVPLAKNEWKNLHVNKIHNFSNTVKVLDALNEAAFADGHS